MIYLQQMVVLIIVGFLVKEIPDAEANQPRLQDDDRDVKERTDDQMKMLDIEYSVESSPGFEDLQNVKEGTDDEIKKMLDIEYSVESSPVLL